MNDLYTHPSNLFLPGNLSPSLTEEEVTEVFRQFGELRSLCLVVLSSQVGTLAVCLFPIFFWNPMACLIILPIDLS